MVINDFNIFLSGCYLGQERIGTASHSGDYGDLIASMSLYKRLGGGNLVLYPTATRHRMDFIHMCIVAPLLEAQDYIDSVEFNEEPLGLNLDNWRHHYQPGLNITDLNFHWLDLPLPERDEPWLTVDPNPKAEVIFCRSQRYHGSFPWRDALDKYHGKSCFVGLPHEHREFESRFGQIPYYETDDLLEAARIIQGARLVLVNQTCLYWISEGLKQTICLEAAGGSRHRNCYWERPGFTYGTSQSMILPEV